MNNHQVCLTIPMTMDVRVSSQKKKKKICGLLPIHCFLNKPLAFLDS